MDRITQFGSGGKLQIGLLLFVCSLVVRFVSRRYLSTLSSIPGPFVASFTRAWRIKEVYFGQVEKVELRLHEAYGILLPFPGHSNQLTECLDRSSRAHWS